jgi:hypothetical protein
MCALTECTMLYIKNWPEDSSLETKHVDNYVFMIIYMLCLTE